MWIMLDVVANHVGPIGEDLSGVGQINPFNQASYYHPYCAINWNNQWSVQNCWLANLPDLNQSVEFVSNGLLTWVNYIVTKYSIDGLRIDTCPEVPMSFWAQYSKSAGVYTVCEVFDGSISTNAGYQGSVDGTLNYPLFYLMQDLFKNGGSFYDARNFMAQAKAAFKNLNVEGNFVDNHDNARFLYNFNKLNRFQNAIAWSMTWPGIPILYYGDEQGYAGGNDPNNREILWPNIPNTSSTMYTFVKTVVQYRKNNQVWNYDWVERYAANNFYCYSRGQAMMAFSNTDSNIMYWVTYHPYAVGNVICNVFYANDCVTVTSQGIPIYLDGGECKLYQLKQ
jgi:alpha-amylase